MAAEVLLYPVMLAFGILLCLAAFCQVAYNGSPRQLLIDILSSVINVSVIVALLF